MLRFQPLKEDDTSELNLKDVQPIVPGVPSRMVQEALLMRLYKESLLLMSKSSWDLAEKSFEEALSLPLFTYSQEKDILNKEIKENLVDNSEGTSRNENSIKRGRISHTAKLARYLCLKNLGRVKRELQKVNESLECFIKAAELENCSFSFGDTIIWIDLAKSALQCKPRNLAIARRALEQCLRVQPGHWPALYMLGDILMEVGDIDGLQDVCDSLSDIDSNSKKLKTFESFLNSSDTYIPPSYFKNNIKKLSPVSITPQTFEYISLAKFLISKWEEIGPCCFVNLEIKSIEAKDSKLERSIEREEKKSKKELEEKSMAENKSPRKITLKFGDKTVVTTDSAIEQTWNLDGFLEEYLPNILDSTDSIQEESQDTPYLPVTNNKLPMAFKFSKVMKMKKKSEKESIVLFKVVRIFCGHLAQLLDITWPKPLLNLYSILVQKLVSFSLEDGEFMNKLLLLSIEIELDLAVLKRDHGESTQSKYHLNNSQELSLKLIPKLFDQISKIRFLCIRGRIEECLGNGELAIGYFSSAQQIAVEKEMQGGKPQSHVNIGYIPELSKDGIGIRVSQIEDHLLFEKCMNLYEKEREYEHVAKLLEKYEDVKDSKLKVGEATLQLVRSEERMSIMTLLGKTYLKLFDLEHACLCAYEVIRLSLEKCSSLNKMLKDDPIEIEKAITIAEWDLQKAVIQLERMVSESIKCKDPLSSQLVYRAFKVISQVIHYGFVSQNIKKNIIQTTDTLSTSEPDEKNRPLELCDYAYATAGRLFRASSMGKNPSKYANFLAMAHKELIRRKRCKGITAALMMQAIAGVTMNIESSLEEEDEPDNLDYDYEKSLCFECLFGVSVEEESQSVFQSTHLSTLDTMDFQRACSLMEALVDMAPAIVSPIGGWSMKNKQVILSVLEKMWPFFAKFPQGSSEYLALNRLRIAIKSGEWETLSDFYSEKCSYKSVVPDNIRLWFYRLYSGLKEPSCMVNSADFKRLLLSLQMDISLNTNRTESWILLAQCFERVFINGIENSRVPAKFSGGLSFFPKRIERAGRHALVCYRFLTHKLAPEEPYVWMLYGRTIYSHLLQVSKENKAVRKELLILGASAYQRLSKLQPEVWQWKLLLGKMIQKLGLPVKRWLSLYAEASNLNSDKDNITAGYRLHCSRLKLLGSSPDDCSEEIQDLVREFSYGKSPSKNWSDLIADAIKALYDMRQKENWKYDVHKISFRLALYMYNEGKKEEACEFLLKELFSVGKDKISHNFWLTEDEVFQFVGKHRLLEVKYRTFLIKLLAEMKKDELFSIEFSSRFKYHIHDINIVYSSYIDCLVNVYKHDKTYKDIIAEQNISSVAQQDEKLKKHQETMEKVLESWLSDIQKFPLVKNSLEKIRELAHFLSELGSKSEFVQKIIDREQEEKDIKEQEEKQERIQRIENENIVKTINIHDEKDASDVVNINAETENKFTIDEEEIDLEQESDLEDDDEEEEFSYHDEIGEQADNEESATEEKEDESNEFEDNINIDNPSIFRESDDEISSGGKTLKIRRKNLKRNIVDSDSEEEEEYSSQKKPKLII